jgi:hypothetical protein
MKSTDVLATLNAYLPNNARSYETKTSTWKDLQVKTTNPLALYTMSLPKSYCFQAYNWGKTNVKVTAFMMARFQR